MADRALPALYLSAGEAYLAALRKLGLYPQVLLWAVDKTIDEFVLVLITSHFDHAGPLEIYRLLTKAYNLAATPKEISPFIVRLHSPRQVIAQSILGFHADIRDREGKRPESQWIEMDRHDLSYRNTWVYCLSQKVPFLMSRQHQWNRFRQNVERLAA